MPRMASRAFAGLLSSEDGKLTAREMSDLLVVSPAAVSGAVKHLENASLVRRTRQAGERMDHYALGDNVWYAAIITRGDLFKEINRVLTNGIEEISPDNPAHARLVETRDFFEFMRVETPLLVERWMAQRKLATT